MGFVRAQRKWLILLSLLNFGAQWGCKADFATTSVSPRFADVRYLVESRHLRSVAELLPLLPAAYRANYVLVFDSRSVQRATLEAPRVVLFAEDSGFVMSFNGSPSELGFESLETMEFDRESKDFRFREIRFPVASTGDAQISAITPSRCSACHGTPARPVWDAFPLWPGVYGERSGVALSARERTGLEAFERLRDDHPRYRYLVSKHEGRLEKDLSQYEGGHHESNGVKFDSLLSRWNLQAILGDVVRSPGFSRYKYGLLEALIPACQEGGALPGAYAQFAFAANRANEVEATLKRFRTLAPVDDSEWPLGRIARAVPLNRFRFLVEDGLGLPTDQWSLALEQGTYDFAAPETDFAELFVEAAARVDSDLSGLYERIRSGALTCDDLRKRHASQIEHDAAVAHSTDEKEPAIPDKPTVLAKCVGCHETEDVGPRLPLASAADFRRAAANSRYPRGSLLNEIIFRLRPEAGSKRMPLNAIASDQERTALVDYFRAIAGEMSDSPR